MKILRAEKIFALRHCCATDTTREPLKGVFLDKENGSAVATDGTKMVIVDDEKIKDIQASIILKFPTSFKKGKELNRLNLALFIGLPSPEDEDKKPFMFFGFAGLEDGDVKCLKDVIAAGYLFCILDVINGQYPAYKEAYPECLSGYFPPFGIDVDILQCITHTLSEMTGHIPGLQVSANHNNLKGIRVKGIGCDAKALIMPLRIKEDDIESDPVPPWTTDTEKAIADLVHEKVLLEARIKELEEKLVGNVPEVTSSSNTVDFRASYKQVRYLAMLSGKKWDELKNLTRQSASDMITELKKERKVA